MTETELDIPIVGHTIITRASGVHRQYPVVHAHLWTSLGAPCFVPGRKFCHMIRSAMYWNCLPMHQLIWLRILSTSAPHSEERRCGPCTDVTCQKKRMLVCPEKSHHADRNCICTEKFLLTNAPMHTMTQHSCWCYLQARVGPAKRLWGKVVVACCRPSSVLPAHPVEAYSPDRTRTCRTH